MPRFCVEPRPYRLIRAQKQNPFFLACAAAISPLQIPATTRASCHHASLHASHHQPPQSRRASSHHHASLHASLHQPPQSCRASSHHHARPPRELLRRLVWRPSTTTRDHCRCLVPLSVSLQVFRRPSTTTRTLSFFCRNCRAAVFFKVNSERVFV
ncbi:hypothetical protein DEO72_LG11g1160 [Vigna unguiculata]|uniref:Uncharacterized protein n=1 Tax=Vigna unguiculata TaxID=3917 RepID=A0A4D6NME6_VIGUN|nr:hypothetical protein DEO72_LG11g1160 [Vigna unguiculata]